MGIDNIVIRATRLTDLPSMVIDCLNPVFKERIYLSMAEAIPVAEAVNHHANQIAIGNPHVVAVDGARVVGLCNVTPSAGPRAAALRHNGTLGMLVAPDYRGHGVGEKLLHAAIKACGDRWERIELGVFSHNERAHRLYLRCGFVEEGRRIGAWKLDSVTSDIIEMVYRPQ